MSQLFRLSGAARRHPRVEAWLAEQVELAGERGRIGLTWFELMRGCGADVRELFHDGCAVACVGDAAFAYVNVFKAHVNVGFFYGATLDDPAGLLEGAGKHMRHVKLRPAQELNLDALKDLIGAAYVDIRSRQSGP